VLGDGLGKLARRARTSRREGYIDAAESVAMLQQLYLHLATAEAVTAARRALAAKQPELVDGKIALVKNTEQFLPHGTRGAHYCYVHRV
jgi:hypothetical protein